MASAKYNKPFLIFFLFVVLILKVQAPCPNSFNEKWTKLPTVPGFCFHFNFTTEHTYSTAFAYCSNFKGDDGAPAYLVEPSTSALHETISYLARIEGGKSVLTGGNDKVREGTWRWDSNSSKY